MTDAPIDDVAPLAQSMGYEPEGASDPMGTLESVIGFLFPLEMLGGGLDTAAGFDAGAIASGMQSGLIEPAGFTGGEKGVFEIALSEHHAATLAPQQPAPGMMPQLNTGMPGPGMKLGV